MIYKKDGDILKRGYLSKFAKKGSFSDFFDFMRPEAVKAISE